MRVRAKLAILGVGIALASAALPTAANAHIVEIDGGSLNTTTITVEQGNTLTQLAQQFDTTWQDIAAWNKLANPNAVTVGETLLLPPAGYKAPANSYAVLFTPAASQTPAPAHVTTSAKSYVDTSSAGIWHCIGYYESGNNPADNTGNGFYGEYQFAAGTWINMMKRMGIAQYQSYPYAAAAPASLQLQAAILLQHIAGWGQWPNTSKRCGV